MGEFVHPTLAAIQPRQGWGTQADEEVGPASSIDESFAEACTRAEYDQAKIARVLRESAMTPGYIALGTPYPQDVG